jgi:hypothetical protein
MWNAICLTLLIGIKKCIGKLLHSSYEFLRVFVQLCQALVCGPIKTIKKGNHLYSKVNKTTLKCHTISIV